MSGSNFVTAILAMLFSSAATIVIAYYAWKRHSEQAVQNAFYVAEKRAKELRILKELAETLNQTLPPDRALQVGLEKTARQVGATAGWFLTLTSDKKAELSAGFNLPYNMELASSSGAPWALCACLKEMVNNRLSTPTLFECERLSRTPGIQNDQKQHLTIPVRASGVPVGILNLVFPGDRSFSETETRLLSALGDQFGGAIERQRLFKEVHKLAITDPLTGIYNRRHFLAIAAMEIERSRRYHRPISMAILDIDYFKQTNDTFGHLAGDRVIQEVARVAQESIRRLDMLGRFGGEEILVLMPETTPERAQQAMERLRSSVEALEVETIRGRIHITVSIGITSLSADENLEFDHFLDRADQALYLAKSEGRNQVRVL